MKKIVVRFTEAQAVDAVQIMMALADEARSLSGAVELRLHPHVTRQITDWADDVDSNGDEKNQDDQT